MKCMHICTIIIVINLCAIITVMYSYANNLPYKQMWSHQAKAMTWVYLKILIFSIFSLYTYWTMYSVNFKSFRLKMTLESLISRYVVQNTTFEISPFKVSSLIPWYNKCTMKIPQKNIFFSSHNCKYTQVVAFAWNMHILLLRLFMHI